MAFETVKKNLESRGFSVQTFATAAEAAEYLSSTYSADTAYWKQRPSILDSEPWSPPKDEEAESEGDK